MDDESILLLNRYQEGDTDAATEIYQRYVQRLIGLARNRISDGLARRVDAEDVIQSVYRSFFAGAKEDGRYTLERSGDLWSLLAAITVNKVRKKARFHGQQKRATSKEEQLSSGISLSSAQLGDLADGPGGPDAIAALEELEAVMTQLDQRTRNMLEMRLQGQSLEEIAGHVGRSQRTVRRSLEEAEQRLRERLFEVQAE